jgi:hypothetical protein
MSGSSSCLGLIMLLAMVRPGLWGRTEMESRDHYLQTPTTILLTILHSAMSTHLQGQVLKAYTAAQCLGSCPWPHGHRQVASLLRVSISGAQPGGPSLPLLAPDLSGDRNYSPGIQSSFTPRWRKAVDLTSPTAPVSHPIPPPPCSALEAYDRGPGSTGVPKPGHQCPVQGV